MISITHAQGIVILYADGLEIERQLFRQLKRASWVDAVGEGFPEA